MLTKCAYCGRALHPDNAYHGENKPGEDDGGELYCDEECYQAATAAEPATYYLVNQFIHWGQIGVKAVAGAVGFVPVFESKMAAEMYRLTLDNAGDYKVEKWRKCND